MCDRFSAPDFFPEREGFADTEYDVFGKIWSRASRYQNVLLFSAPISLSFADTEISRFSERSDPEPAVTKTFYFRSHIIVEETRAEKLPHSCVSSTLVTVYLVPGTRYPLGARLPLHAFIHAKKKQTMPARDQPSLLTVARLLAFEV